MIGFLPICSLEFNSGGEDWNHAKIGVGKCSIQGKNDMERVTLFTMRTIQDKPI